MRIDFSKSLLAFMFPLYMLQPAVQTPDFVVYYVQGNVKKMNAPEQGALKKGAKLLGTDMISLASHAQVILICKNYNNIKLDKPDTIRLNTLLNRCAESKDSFIVSYFHFIWDELFDKRSDPQAYLHNIGAVSRGSGAGRTSLYIDTINYLSGRLKIKLNSSSDPSTLKAFDSPQQGNALFTMNFMSNDFHLDSLASRLKAPGVYYWRVADFETQKRSRYYLKIWQTKAYHNAIDFLLKTVIKTEPAETAYMTGFIMEKNCFLCEAAKYYKTACKLEPQNKIYQAAYSRFL